MFEFAQYQRLLNQSFGVVGNGEFLDDFPVWGEHLNPSGRSRVYRFQKILGARLVSGLSLRLADVRVRNLGTAPIAMIGGVVTHPAYRNQGFASQLLVEAVEWARKQAVSAVVLWSGDESFYQKLGFHSFGRQARIPFKHLHKVFSQIQDLDPKHLKKGWDQRIFDGVCSRNEGIVYSSEDLRWYSAHKNVRWYTLQDPENQFAYIGVGRGIDLKQMVHEWGGSSSGVMKLFKYVYQQEPDLSVLCHPSFVGSDSWEPLCLAKILDKNFEKTEMTLWFWGLDAV